MKIFTSHNIGKLQISNRVIRSATFEGMADEKGFVTDAYIDYYESLAPENIGAIICGFAYVSKEGKAMHPGQLGVDAEDKIPGLRKVADTVHKHEGTIFMQLAHAGRQTLAGVTGQQPVGSSTKKSVYFQQKPKALSITEIEQCVEHFSNAAWYCQQAGFDGVQLHAAHGYLIHQFITPAINKRTDVYGIDGKTKIGIRFLQDIIEDVRKKCGDDFPVLLKVSAGDDLRPSFTRKQFVNLIQAIDKMAVDAVEISYGTMDYAMNIFRGEFPENLILKKNPIYLSASGIQKFLTRQILIPSVKRKLIPFSKAYNLENARLAKEHTSKPLICVGGFRTGVDMKHALEQQIDFVSLSRPLICEPDFVSKLKKDITYESKCTLCNYCAIMCDSPSSLRCYRVE